MHNSEILNLIKEKILFCKTLTNYQAVMNL